MPDTRSKILDTAEAMVRAGGYNGFSFREIASLVGIKSASVHHHFPTKEALTLEVARRYHENFFAALGAPRPAGHDPEAQLGLYCQVFKEAFQISNRACLCGVLASEAEQLPNSVKDAVVAFVEANIAWLEQALEKSPNDTKSRKRAELVYTALEGAMGVASLQQDHKWIDRVSEAVCLTALSRI
ncbi:MAG: TetR/AcrR family transcriptional regulator [Verrucomicrobiota bacterium]